MSTDVTTYVSREEYLAAERAATDFKSEWIDGEVREMVVASRKHNLVGINVGGVLRQLLKGQAFEVYVNDMKVRIPDGPYRHPDVVVAPGEALFEDEHEDVLLNPLVLFEVLSPSTEATDRGAKLDEYRRIPSLTDYLIVAQDSLRVDHYRRAAEVAWELEILNRAGGGVSLRTLDVEVPIAEVYDRVFPSNEATPEGTA